MNINAQKRLASEVLKCGVNRVYVHPDGIDDVLMAITREDIRNLVKNKVIQKRYKAGISRARVNENLQKKRDGRMRGFGSRKGKRAARQPPKRAWINRIRPLRREMKKLRDTNKIDTKAYRLLYLKAKGGAFNSVATLYRFIEENKLYRS